jgi:hypothetical protein
VAKRFDNFFVFKTQKKKKKKKKEAQNATIQPHMTSTRFFVQTQPNSNLNHPI